MPCGTQLVRNCAVKVLSWAFVEVVLTGEETMVLAAFLVFSPPSLYYFYMLQVMIPNRITSCEVSIPVLLR